MGAAFTPGPWKVVAEGSAEHRWVVGDAEGGSIASCEPMGPWITGAEAEANTRLIAAAPELYEAVQYAADVFDDYARQHRTKGTDEGNAKAARNSQRRDKMRAALAKARGDA